MTYEVMIRAVPVMTQSIADKHQSFLAAIADLLPPWGIINPLPAPDPGGELLAEVRLRGHLGTGLRGSIVYRYRGGLRDKASCDDYLKVEFDPGKNDWSVFSEAVFPAYVQAFCGYRGHAGDMRFSAMDFEAKRHVDARRGVFRFHPVNYFDGSMCQAAFGLSPSQFLDRVKPVVHCARLVGNGILVIGRPNPVELEEAQTLNDTVWRVIRCGAQELDR